MKPHTQRAHLPKDFARTIFWYEAHMEHYESIEVIISTDNHIHNITRISGYVDAFSSPSGRALHNRSSISYLTMLFMKEMWTARIFRVQDWTAAKPHILRHKNHIFPMILLVPSLVMKFIGSLRNVVKSYQLRIKILISQEDLLI